MTVALARTRCNALTRLNNTRFSGFTKYFNIFSILYSFNYKIHENSFAVNQIEHFKIVFYLGIARFSKEEGTGNEIRSTRALCTPRYRICSCLDFLT